MKFKESEDAAKCIETSAGSEGIFLDKRQIYCLSAMKKGEYLFFCINNSTGLISFL